MPEKYHIHAEPAEPRYQPVFKLSSTERDLCLGCTDCAKRNCIYDVYKKRAFLPSELVDSSGSFCKSCMRCVQECKNNILTKLLNPEYTQIGNSYWTPAILTSLWQQAHAGKIPVSGAGYDGPFSGTGFDDMWTDMSEIVRPTRDGIHGREYISTAIDIGTKLDRLHFNGQELADNLPPMFSLPLPIIFDVPRQAGAWKGVKQAVQEAAREIQTLAFCDDRGVTGSHIIPRYGINEKIDPDSSSKMIEIFLESCEGLLIDKAEKLAGEISKNRPGLVICIGLPISKNTARTVVKLAKNKIGTFHLYANHSGKGTGSDSDYFIKEIVRETHRALLAESIRDCVTILAGGGIAMAEHVAKLIACGADGVVVDNALLVALECRMCLECLEEEPCHVHIDAIDPQWGTKRIVNLLASWHSQLIEVMGAMGLREVRRLRGETGRVMFFRDLEEECYAPIFGKRVW